jgi:DNA-binding NarL/FixJ family response regulator
MDWEVAMRRLHTFSIVLIGKSILRREGLSRILRSANFRILASASRAEDVPPGKLQLCRPLFLIVHPRENFSATIEQIEISRDRYPDGRIAIVADHYRLDELVSAFRAGAQGYFSDFMACDVFIRSIELMIMGEIIIPSALLSFLLNPHDCHGDHAGEPALTDQKNEAILIATEGAIAPQLSPREKSILRCLIDGDSNKIIARKIDIAEATVKVHVKAILRKIRVQNRTQAAIWGMNNVLPARTINSEPTQLISDLSERLSIDGEKILKIKQVDEPIPLNVVGHESTSRPERFFGKRKGRDVSDAANIRPLGFVSSHRSK